jgi:hypothetical protein
LCAKADAVHELPPDAVRVWRGFRRPTVELPAFYERLNTVFVPATVLMQIDAGLDGYVPTVPAGLPEKPDEVPDETAILFWDSQQTYRDSFKTLAVRTYTLTHGAVYTPSSGAGFPLSFTGELNTEQPYYLVEQAVDWMHGAVRHLVAGRPAGVDPGTFRAQVAGQLLAAQRSGMLAAIACAGEDYFVYWELENDDPASIDARFAALSALAAWSHTAAAKPVSLDVGLWEEWAGMGITPGDCLNLQFERRWQR